MMQSVELLLLLRTNKNSDVIVEAAVLPDGQEPKNSDWKPLSEVITVNKNRTKDKY